MKPLDLEKAKKLIKSLSDFLVLSPRDTAFARLEILTPITSSPETGETLPAGEYLIDYDAKIYTAIDTEQEVLPGFSAQKISLVTTPRGDPMTLAHIIFYIGEYMGIPAEANKLLDNYFSDEYERQLQAEALDALPRLLSIVPQKHLIPNSKLTNSLTQDIIDAGTVEIEVSSPRAKQPIDIICNLVYEGDNVKITGRQSFTEYDRNVYNAVTSLFVYGDQSHVITPAIVYRAMTGMSAAENPSPQQIGAVTKSLDKMRFIRAVVDISQELKQRRVSLNGEYVTNGIIDTYLLNASVIQVKAGGKSVRAYKLEKTPVLYAYSNALHQVYTVPAYLLDVKTVDKDTGKATGIRVSNTESRIQVKGYLLRRIEGMKGDNALKNDVIRLQSYEKGGKHHPGLYEIAGNPEPTTKDATRIRDYAAAALAYWKAQNYITDYQFTKTGRQITGIKITL